MTTYYVHKREPGTGEFHLLHRISRADVRTPEAAVKAADPTGSEGDDYNVFYYWNDWRSNRITLERAPAPLRAVVK